MRLFATWCGEPIVTRETAPDELAVSVDDAKAALRIAHDDEDDFIEDLINLALDHLEGWRGALRRPLVTQSWRVAVPEADGNGRLFAPLAPVIALESIEYYAPGSATLSAATAGDFRLIKSPDWAYLEPLPGNSWPSLDDRPDALQAVFTCGYGGPDDVPPAIRHAIKLLAGHFNENREEITALKLERLPLGVNALIGPYRNGVYG